jgi:hypothetical protein
MFIRWYDVMYVYKFTKHFNYGMYSLNYSNENYKKYHPLMHNFYIYIWYV